MLIFVMMKRTDRYFRQCIQQQHQRHKDHVVSANEKVTITDQVAPGTEAWHRVYFKRNFIRCKED